MRRLQQVLRRNRPSLASRLRSEGGFGLIELLIAMTVTTVAVMALVAALSSSYVSLLRASRISTSAAIASAQLERYRAIRYTEIRLAQPSVSGADSTYKQDDAYTAVTDGRRVMELTGCTDTSICNATRTVTGADGRPYRLDTYIVYETPQTTSGTLGRDVKRVTVVVRDAGTVRVRETSSFDAATGS